MTLTSLSNSVDELFVSFVFFEENRIGLPQKQTTEAFTHLYFIYLRETKSYKVSNEAIMLENYKALVFQTL